MVSPTPTATPRPETTSAIARAPNGDGEGDAALSCLLVEDTRHDRERLRRLADASSLRCRFAEATTMNGALRMMGAGEYDVIILDRNLPDGDGLRLVEELNKQEPRGRTPIIMISGMAESGLADQAMRRGCSGFLSKEALSTDKFDRSVRDAVAQMGRRLQHDAGSEEARLVRRALESFAADCLSELQIPLSRMMRLLREAKARSAKGEADADLAAIEMIGRDMWDFLEHVRTQSTRMRS